MLPLHLPPHLWCATLQTAHCSTRLARTRTVRCDAVRLLQLPALCGSNLLRAHLKRMWQPRGGASLSSFSCKFSPLWTCLTLLSPCLYHLWTTTDLALGQWDWEDLPPPPPPHPPTSTIRPAMGGLSPPFAAFPHATRPFTWVYCPASWPHYAFLLAWWNIGRIGHGLCFLSDCCIVCGHIP